MSTCAFVSCVEAADCGLVGGCVPLRFAHVPKYEKASTLRANAPALTGTKPRASRDPRFTPRKRKAITR